MMPGSAGAVVAAAAEAVGGAEEAMVVGCVVSLEKLAPKKCKTIQTLDLNSNILLGPLSDERRRRN